MEIIKTATEWAKAEVFSASFFIFFAIIFLCSSLGFWQLGKTESGMTIMAYVSILGTIYLSGPTWYLWQPPDAAQLLILVTIGIVGTTGQFLFVHAFKRAEASALAPIDYVRLVFAVLAGYFLYAEIPDLWTWTGAAIIITSALAVTRLEHRAERSLRGSTP